MTPSGARMTENPVKSVILAPLGGLGPLDSEGGMEALHGDHTATAGGHDRDG